MNQLSNEELAKLTKEINEVLAKYDADMEVVSKIQITKRNGGTDEKSNPKAEESGESGAGKRSK